MRAPPRTLQHALIALIFVGAGIGHFVRPGPYVGIVPPVLPAKPLLVAISGVAEIVGGIGVMSVPLRRFAGFWLIVLLVAVFPANIYMLTSAIAAGKPDLWLALLWLRLPLQPLLIWWIWRVAVRDPDGMLG